MKTISTFAHKSAPIQPLNNWNYAKAHNEFVRNIQNTHSSVSHKLLIISPLYDDDGSILVWLRVWNVSAAKVFYGFSLLSSTTLYLYFPSISILFVPPSMYLRFVFICVSSTLMSFYQSFVRFNSFLFFFVAFSSFLPKSYCFMFLFCVCKFADFEVNGKSWKDSVATYRSLSHSPHVDLAQLTSYFSIPQTLTTAWPSFGC